jgi:hypothetical protein
MNNDEKESVKNAKEEEYDFAYSLDEISATEIESLIEASETTNC